MSSPLDGNGVVAPYRAGDKVVTHHFDEVLTVTDCFDAVGGWRMAGRLSTLKAKPENHE